MNKNYNQTDKELLLAHVLKKPRSFIMAHPELKLNKTQTKKFKELSKKRAKGLPMQYILGYAWFYGRKFKVTEDVLIPRPETETLIEAALSIIPKNSPANIFDIGCGSGCIGITLAAQRPKAKIFCSDISPKALGLAKKNLHKKRRKKIIIKKGYLLRPWEKILNLEKNNFIVANLPYLSLKTYKKTSEPKIALYGGKDGLQLYRELFKQIKKIKTNIRAVIIEIDPSQSKKASKLLPLFETSVYKDLTRHKRVVAFNNPLYNKT